MRGDLVKSVRAELVEALPFLFTEMMTFWAYMIQCADRHFYTGHTDDLEMRIGQHQAGLVEGYTSTRLPIHLVWSQEFPTRYEALATERRIKGWSRAKKLALIRGDWGAISTLARKSEKKGRASTSSARTVRKTELLYPHPSLLPSEAFSLETEAHLINGRLTLHFRLTGPVATLRVPAPAPSTRRDNLWQHSCFEAFIALADGAYLEFNFSPSSAWAAYRFSGYREGITDLAIEPPTIRVESSDQLIELTVEVEISETPLRLGLSAVIEETDGTKSYWALRHPPGDKPDFHHPDCFALELPAPSAP